jgi:hypothetical protein
MSSSSKCFFPFWISHHNPIHFPVLSHVPPTSLSLIWSAQQHLGIITKCEAPHCATSFILLLLHPSLVQTFSLEPCSQTSSVYTVLFLKYTICRIMLNYVFERVCEVCSEFMQLSMVSSGGLFWTMRNISNFIKVWELLDQLSEYQLLKKDSM